MGETVTMHVFDQEYYLRINSDSGRQRLEVVAELVDRKMKDVAARYVSLTAKEIAAAGGLPPDVTVYRKPIPFQELRGYVQALLALRRRQRNAG